MNEVLDQGVSDELTAVVAALDDWAEWARPFRQAGTTWTAPEEALWQALEKWTQAVLERAGG